jgi:serine/threonine protein phosphatase 1
MNSWVITDIHGCRATLDVLLERLDLQPADRLFFLGDYVDRGADSKGVIDRIWELEAAGHAVLCLGGNHEEMLVYAWKEGENSEPWYSYSGGREAVASFGTNEVRDIPPQYIRWMENLPLWYEVDGYILVHAGFDFRLDDPFADREAMRWIRRWYGAIDYNWLGDRMILHGHTPVSIQKVEQMLGQLDDRKVLDLDAGCVHNRPQLGNLCAFRLEDQKLVYVPRVDSDLIIGQ